MEIFSSIKAYIIGAIAVIIAGLGVALKIVLRQKAEAQQKADRLKRRAEAIKKQHQEAKEINESVDKAQEEARDYARSEKERIDNGDRPDTWGSDRLRNKD